MRLILVMLVAVAAGVASWLHHTAGSQETARLGGSGGTTGPVAGDRPPEAAKDALLEPGKHGAIPKAGPKGEMAWRAYARPFDQSDKRPRVAVVVVGLGLNKTVTEAAITELPGAVSLAFSPHADELEAYLATARERGHETLMMLPMEPHRTATVDPGPRALLATLDTDQNRDRLHWVLSRGTGYVGVVVEHGRGFLANADVSRPALAELARRGLLLIDGRAGDVEDGKRYAAASLPWARATVWADNELTQEGIQAKLRGAEAIAKRGVAAVVLARPYPLTLTQLRRWAESLDKDGLTLAPASAVVSTAPPK